MPTSRFILILSGALLLVPGLSAQSTATATAAAPASSPLTLASNWRGNLAAAVAQGTQTPGAALLALRAKSGASGLGVDSDADLGFAAAAIGHQLLAVGKAKEAGTFFAQAEQSLAASVAKIPDARVQDKTQRLAALAMLRHTQLNNPIQAKADLKAALRLNPKDAYLQQLWVYLASQNAEVYGSGLAN